MDASVKKAMEDGYTFACATCIRLHVAREEKLEGCLAVHLKLPCCGPFGGGHYPEYMGPLDGHLDKFCFVCGVESDGACVIKVGDQVHLVGICDAHMERIEDTSPKGNHKPPFVTHQILPVIG